MKIALVMDANNCYTTGIYFKDVFIKSSIPYTIFSKTNQRRITSEYTLVFYVDDGTHYYIYPHPDKLKVLYIIDTHMGIHDDKKLFRFADAIFCAQKNAEEYIRRFASTAQWVPLACDPEFHRSARNEKRYDLAYIGGYGTDRRKAILESLKQLYPNSYIGNALKEQIGEIYGAAKIVINVAINNDINMRFFEALCAGSLLLTDRITKNGLEELLAMSATPFCVVFDSYEDMIAKINHYLSHEQEREAIALAGQRFAESNTYADRWRVISSALQSAHISNKSVLSYWVHSAFDKGYHVLGNRFSKK